MNAALSRAVVDAAIIGPIAAAAAHNVSLTALYAIINQRDKQMINATVTVTDRLSTDTAFAVRQDDRSFAQVFLPSHLVRNGNLQVGSKYDVILTENDEPLRDRTPWRATQLRADPSVDDIEPAKAAPKPTPSALIDDRIIEQLSASLYMTTGEITTELGGSGTIVRDRLMAMFNRNQIVRADVHARPNLQRATMCLWAIDIDAFIAGEGEE